AGARDIRWCQTEVCSLILHTFRKFRVGLGRIHKVEAEDVFASFVPEVKTVAVDDSVVGKAAVLQDFPFALWIFGVTRLLSRKALRWKEEDRSENPSEDSRCQQCETFGRIHRAENATWMNG